MKSGFVKMVGLTSILILMMVMPSCALAVTEWPDRIYVGESINVQIDDLLDGQQFCTEINDANVNLQSDGTFYFYIQNLNIPFVLHNSQVRIEAESVEWAELRLKMVNSDEYWLLNDRRPDRQRG